MKPHSSPSSKQTSTTSNRINSSNSGRKISGGGGGGVMWRDHSGEPSIRLPSSVENGEAKEQPTTVTDEVNVYDLFELIAYKILILIASSLY